MHRPSKLLYCTKFGVFTRIFLYRATFLRHESTNVGRINTESVAIPVIMRGSDGKFFANLILMYIYQLLANYKLDCLNVVHPFVFVLYEINPI